MEGFPHQRAPKGVYKAMVGVPSATFCMLVLLTIFPLDGTRGESIFHGLLVVTYFGVITIPVGLLYLLRPEK